MSQKAKVLQMLKEKPCSNKEFYGEFMPRYGARIADLRKEGHMIITEQTSRNTFMFTLLS